MTLFLLLAVVAGATMSEMPPPLRVNMISIVVTDMDRPIRFYTETVGLPLAGPRGEVTMIRAGEITIALNKPLARMPVMQLPAPWRLSFPSKAFPQSKAAGSARMQVHRCRA